MKGKKAAALLFSILFLGGVHAEDRSIDLGDGNSLPVEVFPAQGQQLLLWLPAETGLKAEDRALARQLAARGKEVWLLDLFSAYFLPLGASSLDGLPNMALIHVFDEARNTGKSIVVVAPGRAAIPALRAINAYQRQQATADIRLLLLHPKLYEPNPQPGSTARLMPVVAASDVPVFILQPEQSPWRWRLGEIRTALEANGSEVFSWLIPGVRDRYWFRPDANAAERSEAKRLAWHIEQSLRLLGSVPGRARRGGTIEGQVAVQGRQDKTLQPYSGDPQPPPLALAKLSGGVDDLRNYHGQVVLVNFWASWCPPCVHEMPDMQALYARYRDKGFHILAVNMADPPQVIRDFLQHKVKVNFEILLDADGAALQRWQVFAFPTSYLVDRQGRIRYAVYGAIEWQSEDTLHKLQQLLRE